MSGLNKANIWHFNTLSTTHVPAILIFIYIRPYLKQSFILQAFLQTKQRLERSTKSNLTYKLNKPQ